MHAGPNGNRFTQASRRGFVQGSLAALAWPRVPRLRRPSDALRLAVVGLNGRGSEHLEALRARADVHVAVLCDVDDQLMVRGVRAQRERSARPDAHADLRHVLERRDVDAVVLATPNHWHALQTIWACQAGKDVFVESPATHVWSEGEHVLAAARQAGRLVQVGLPARASPALREAIEWVRAGNLGGVRLVRGLCYEARPSIGNVKGNQPIPETLDYDLWCGPAPLTPLRRAHLHGDWRWIWATGDGELGATGAHVLDLARWVIGVEDVPTSVLSIGARLGYEDDGETPNTQMVFYAYEPTPILIEVRGLPRDLASREGDWAAAMDTESGVRTGLVVQAENGTLRIPGPGLATAHDGEGREVRRWEEKGDALAGWIAALTSRNPAALTSELEVGMRSAGLVHLGNVSQRVARGLEVSALLEELKSSAVLTSTCERLLAHLEANGIDVSKPALALGPCLVLDPGRGCFREHEEANRLLAGRYREPFVLPPL